MMTQKQRLAYENAIALSDRLMARRHGQPARPATATGLRAEHQRMARDFDAGKPGIHYRGELGPNGTRQYRDALGRRVDKRDMPKSILAQAVGVSYWSMPGSLSLVNGSLSFS